MGLQVGDLVLGTDLDCHDDTYIVEAELGFAHINYCDEFEVLFRVVEATLFFQFAGGTLVEFLAKFKVSSREPVLGVAFFCQSFADEDLVFLVKNEYPDTHAWSFGLFRFHFNNLMDSIVLFGFGFWGFTTLLNKTLIRIFFPKSAKRVFLPVLHPSIKRRQRVATLRMLSSENQFE